MDSSLLVYEGDKLKLKDKEGVAKFIELKTQKADEMMKSITK